MKKIILTAASLALGASAFAATIDITGSTNTTGQNNGGEFADWTGLPVVSSPPGTTMPTSSVNDGTITLSLIDSAAPYVSQTWSSGTVYSVGAEANFSAGATNADAAAAFASNAYLEINLSSLAFTSDVFDVNSISVSLWRNGTGAANNYQFAYASDGIYDTADLLGSATTVASFGIANAALVSFSSTAFVNNVTNDSIRLYYWGSANNNGNTHLYNVTADYSVIPEPSNAAMLGVVLGLGLLRRSRR